MHQRSPEGKARGWGWLTDVAWSNRDPGCRVGVEQGIDWLVMHSSSLKESRVLNKASVTSEGKGGFAGS